jgi:hypothetical protein
MVQVEALFDPGIIEGLDSAPWMASWYEHARRGLHGNVRSPTFGGGTIRAEFEALTGHPLEAFPNVQYPYYGLVHDRMETLPRTLRSMGYATKVVHPFKSSFWNREIAMRTLGFDTLEFQDAFPRRDKRAGPYIGDDILYERIAGTAPGQTPTFTFAITMENHGPWHTDFRAMLDDDLPELPDSMDGLPAKSRKELRRYLWHVRHGDQALGQLLSSLLARERPTLVAVYSDHMPGLSATWRHVEFDNGKRQRAQTVPFMIVSNFGTPARDLGTLPMHALPSLVLEAAGLPMHGHFAADTVLRGLRGRHPDARMAAELRRNAAWRDWADQDDDAGPGAARANTTQH